MPSPEAGGYRPEQPKHHPSTEAESGAYLRAARFTGDRPAGQVYVALQDALYATTPNDLSAYRLQLNRVWHVAVLGQPPPPELDARIAAILAAGESVTLPAELVVALAARRAQAIPHGPWTERHYRPLPPSSPEGNHP